jgi:hypothetical protein
LIMMIETPWVMPPPQTNPPSTHPACSRAWHVAQVE